MYGRIDFNRTALREARKAVAWYAQRSEENASRFRAAIESAARAAAAGKRTHAIGRSRYQYVRLRRFPYQLIFKVVGIEGIRVIAVAHNRRRPGYWRGRR